MDDIDFSLPVGEPGEYVLTNAVGRCAAKLRVADGIGFRFSVLVSLRRNGTGAAVPAM
jgi:hypothetical protein